MNPVSGTGDDMGARLRELRQQGVAVGVGDIRGVTAANKEGRVLPGGHRIPADDVVVLRPEYRHVEPPLAVDKRLQQKLNYAFFIKMFAHDGCGLLAG